MVVIKLLHTVAIKPGEENRIIGMTSIIIIGFFFPTREIFLGNFPRVEILTILNVRVGFLGKFNMEMSTLKTLLRSHWLIASTEKMASIEVAEKCGVLMVDFSMGNFFRISVDIYIYISIGWTMSK